MQKQNETGQPADHPNAAAPPPGVPVQPPPAYMPPQQQQGYGQPQAVPQNMYGPPQGGYGQPHPGYGQPLQPMVGQPPTQVTVITQSPVAKPANYLALAIVTTLCCNCLFGLIAIIFSVLSSSSADDGDLEGARYKGKVSMWLSIAGIIISIVSIIIVIIYVVVIAAHVVKGVSDAIEDAKHDCCGVNQYCYYDNCCWDLYKCVI